MIVSILSHSTFYYCKVETNQSCLPSVKVRKAQATTETGVFIRFNGSKGPQHPLQMSAPSTVSMCHSVNV